MSAPANIPSPVSSSSGSSSPVPPPTPLTPNSASFTSQPADQFAFDALQLDNSTGNAPTQATNGGPARRKPSRRANTAERRATHNMVERQRREALNGRFLDLAALLPNLASVRRPSKSAIVNSSIALIHTQRRARATAARELRLLKLEADALRAELNEWRERAGMGLARLDEPIRSREFEELVSGGLEEAEEGLLEEERRALEIVKEGLRMDASDMMMNPQGPFAFSMGANGMYGLAEDDDDDSTDGQAARLRPGSQGSLNGVPSLPMPISIPRQNSLNANPMIFDPSAALLQSHTTHQAGINPFPSYDLSGAPQTHPSLSLGMVPKQSGNWNTPIYTLGQGYPTQQQMFTPPSSATATSANFLGGFGLRDDDDASSNHSGSVSDISAAFNAAMHPGLAAHRTRSASTIATLQTKNLNVAAGSATPPQSAPPTATTYAEAAAAQSAGDVFSAPYNTGFPTRVAGGGNPYGAAMGLFM